MAADPETLTIDVPGASLALHGARWVAGHGPSSSPVVATLVLVHGLGDHLGNHAALARELAGRLPIEVVAFDFRGHGRSPGPRGYVAQFDDLRADLSAVEARVRGDRPGLRRFLFGHSMGGTLAASAAIEAPAGTYDGLILSSPFLGHTSPVPWWRLAAGHLLHHLAPRITLGSELDPSHLTRDEAAWAARRADPLSHNRISAPLYFGMRAAAESVRAHARAIQMPTLLVIGGDDTIASPDASRRFFDALGTADRTLLDLPGFRHEPYLDIGHEVVVDATAAWLAARLTGESDVRP
jgi:alpha-beta hydrolase superfamily lysophospholipase